MGCLTGKTKTRTYTDTPRWYDPLGPSSIDASGQQVFQPTGGAEQRAAIFSGLTQLRSGPLAELSNWWSAQAQSLPQAPEYQAGLAELQRTLQGDYLRPNPFLLQSLEAQRSAALTAAEQQAARNRAAMTRAGLGYSTVQQMADRAALTGLMQQWQQASAQALADAYARERAQQLAAIQGLPSYLGAPLTWAAAAQQGLLAPWATQAEVVRALAGGGTVATPQTTMVQSRTPGLLDYGLELAKLAVPWGNKGSTK